MDLLSGLHKIEDECYARESDFIERFAPFTVTNNASLSSVLFDSTNCRIEIKIDGIEVSFVRKTREVIEWVRGEQ